MVVVVVVLCFSFILYFFFSLGKKAPDRQFTSYLLTYVWRVLSHNMVGKKVLMSSAFKALREKVLAHLTRFFFFFSCFLFFSPSLFRWAVNETLRLGPHEDFSLSYRIRYNLCCLIEDLATEINFLSKIAPIGFDTQTILGPVVHEACFVFLLEATLYSPSGQEIRSQGFFSFSFSFLSLFFLSFPFLIFDPEAVALASKKEVHHKADTAKVSLFSLLSFPLVFTHPTFENDDNLYHIILPNRAQMSFEILSQMPLFVLLDHS